MRVLIADDDPVALLLLESVLEDWGYEVVSESDGARAWERLREADAPPLAIIDWMMPGMDGVDVCRRVRQESEAAYVYLILLTGKARSQDIIMGMESGADDYVSKPFDENELKVRLRAGRRIVELQEKLREQATRDPLAGSWNRRSILDILNRESARSAREGEPVGVIMVDLDHFKRLNDTHGHLAGDAVIREAARRMEVAMRTYDALGRYGGEEFLVVLPRCEPSEILAVAERLRHALADEPMPIPSGVISITASLGAAIGHGPSLDASEMIRIADEALYRAKRDGRNRVASAFPTEVPVP